MRVSIIPNPLDGKPTDILDNEDLQQLFNYGIQEIRYWYNAGGWEGEGFMVFKLNTSWGWHNMGHCSCYGPLEHFIPREYQLFHTFENLIESVHIDYLPGVKPLCWLEDINPHADNTWYDPQPNSESTGH